MNTSIFIALILGHLTGDYLLQSHKMSQQKSAKGLIGFGWCLFHCLIYAASVCLFLQTTELSVIVLIIASHFPIDRWSLANKWLKMIGGRDLKTASLIREKNHDFHVAFACLKYAIADNTLHLIIMWIGFNWLIY